MGGSLAVIKSKASSNNMAVTIWRFATIWRNNMVNNMADCIAIEQIVTIRELICNNEARNLGFIFFNL
jgi:DNA gyrase inhibitor GyrI